MTAHPLPAAGSRLVLAPGLRVVEHGRDAWQVGLDPRRRVRLARDPVTTTALDVVATASPAPADDAVLATLAGLRDAGLVVPLRELCTDAPTGPAASTAALAAQFPHDFDARRARRREAVVGVHGSLGADAGALLADAGVATCPVEEPDATAALVLGRGEVDREVLAHLLRRGVPHLVARVVDGVALLGPLVVPGRTACVRCLDLHAADEEPGAELRAWRYAAASARPRSDGLAEPLDLVQATLLTAWAVRDLLTHVEGDRPPSWSATVRLEPDLAALEAVSWLRHPECGCALD